jgi:hypothetical protein
MDFIAAIIVIVKLSDFIQICNIFIVMLSVIMLSVVAPLASLTLTFLPKTFLKLCSSLFQNIQIYSKFIGFYPLFSISATNLKLSDSNFMQILVFYY